MYKGLYFLKVGLLFALVITGCKKQDNWLEAKNSKSLVVPETLDDYQAILDDFTTVSSHFPIAGLAGTDNYFVSDVNFNTLDLTIRNLYLWERSIWADDRSIDWDYSFTLVEYANIVIDGLQKIKDKESQEYRYVIGQAYFLRALAFYNLAQLFCKPYDSSSFANHGLPLRNTSDVNILFSRSTLKETYEQIITDAATAADLLPNELSSIYRASKIAANALLAKTNLVMGNFELALENANKVLNVKNDLLDFNSNLIDPLSTNRFPASGRNNPEIIFYGEGTGYNLVMPSVSSPAFVDSILISKYEDDDLRLSLFYTKEEQSGYYRFTGSYTGNNMTFCGIGVNEILLVRAECLARLGQADAAIADLTMLLDKRYKTGKLIPVIDPTNVLEETVYQRRMELPFTANIRWEDLRRLNLAESTAETIMRNVAGKHYILEAGDPKYTLPIPVNEIQFSGIIQNER